LRALVERGALDDGEVPSAAEPRDLSDCHLPTRPLRSLLPVGPLPEAAVPELHAIMTCIETRSCEYEPEVAVSLPKMWRDVPRWWIGSRLVGHDVECCECATPEAKCACAAEVRAVNGWFIWRLVGSIEIAEVRSIRVDGN
jgi:hypothetical protein